MAQEKLDFGADVSRLLDIVANALYSNRDVFLRELISNASDACDRLRYESITAPELIKDAPEFRLRISPDAKARRLTIADNGIGMNRADLVENLGTIAKSGTASLMEQMSDITDKKDRLSLIGQFGVGFYACFMIAHKVEVISRKTSKNDKDNKDDNTIWHWESDGRTGFTIREATKKEAAQLIDGRGTSITLHINDDASDYLIPDKLEHVIQTYSDHIGFPIYLGDQNDDEKPVNQVSALWMRPRNEITPEQHAEFFRHIGFGFDDPLMTSHWRAEGALEYTALLYMPTLRPMDLYDPNRSHAVKLYVKRVFISDNCEGLVYPWLRFMRGVIDSEDLPLNISRETLQDNPLIARIRNNVTKRILSDLDKLSREDTEKFNAFWGQFGPVIKEGLYDAFEHRDALLKITRFYSTHKDGELVSLADYTSRMPEHQDRIYYMSGEKLETLKHSPQLEGFKARGIEVLFFTDTIDDFWLQTVLDYDGKPFQSVTKGNIDLSKFDSDDTKSDNEDNADKPQSDTLEALKSAVEKTLEGEIGEVRFSARMTDSPVCLVAGDHEVDLRMERVLRINQKYEADSKRVLEINPKHPLVLRLADLATRSASATDLSDAAWLLLDQARIIQGEPITDPSGFSRRMSHFMERGLQSTADTEKAA